MANQTHEGYLRQEATVPGSDRSFGIVMAAAFALLALINFWRGGHAWPWTGALAVAFYAGSQEVLALARSGHDGGVRRSGGPDQGLCGRTVHLYAVLTDSRCASSASRHFTTTAQPR